MNGEPLKRLRKERDLSVRKLADMAHVSVSTIEKIEQGRANPNYDTLYSLSTTLQVTLDILCGINLDRYHVKIEDNDIQITFHDKYGTNSRLLSYMNSISELNKSIL